MTGNISTEAVSSDVLRGDVLGAVPDNISTEAVSSDVGTVDECNMQ